MIILIFLGILWLKYNSSNKEGLDADNIKNLSSELENTVKDKLAEAGVDTTKATTSLSDGFDKINEYIDREIKDIDNQISGTGTGTGTSISGSIDSTTAVDTTGSDYYPSKSFFIGSRFSDGFCKNNTNPVELNNACSSLTAENCNLTDCCVLLQGNKCVAGNALGPTNIVDERGNDIDYAYYSYKNQCYGSCGKGLANAANPCSEYEITDTGLSERCIKRLWSQAGCPNGAYITNDITNELKNNSKAAIQMKFKNARKDEPNYDKCYGPNQSRWPVPCNDTTDTSIDLSARCLTKLFTDVGCTNTDTITDAFAIANKLESKSAMINAFTDLTNAYDDSEGKLTKCYGSDESQWPDPCEGVPDTANLIAGNLPLRCAFKIFKDVTGCPSTDYITRINSEIASSSIDQKNAYLGNTSISQMFSKPGLAAQYSNSASQIQNNRFKCYGINPNNWPDDLGINKMIPDPCDSMKSGIKASDVSTSCKTRLIGSDIFPTTNCTNDIYSTIVNKIVKKGIDNGSGYMFDVLSLVEDSYNSVINQFCKPDPPASGYLSGAWIRDNKDSIPVVAAKYLNDGNTIVYLASEGEYIKMATNTGVAKFYRGSVNDFKSSNWNTYSDAGNNYKYRPN